MNGDVLFEAEGFVHTDKPEHYVKTFDFTLSARHEALLFEFYASGKEIFFHVIDPEGMIRVQHQSKLEISNAVLHSQEDLSSPGTCPGLIQEGKWIIKVFAYAPRYNRMWGKIDFVFKVRECNPEELGMPGGYKSWVAAVPGAAGSGRIKLKEFEPDQDVKKISPEWLNSDFHVHTMLTDGSAYPADLLDEAKAKKIDYFFITEHNILTTGFSELSGVTVFPSYEVTTVRGHFNAHGLRYIPEKFLEQGPDPSWEFMSSMIDRFRNDNVLISINHPFFEPWEWQYEKLPLEWIDSIEVVTDPWDRRTDIPNEKAFALIDLMWNNGYRAAGIGGSDTHTRFSDSQLGQPATRLFSKRGSLESILDSVKQAAAVIVPDSSVQFRYVSSGIEIIPGTGFTGKDDIDIELELDIPESGNPLILEIIEEGKVRESFEALPGRLFKTSWQWKGKISWFRCSLRHPEGNLAGFINPLYRNREIKPSIRTWGEALKEL